MWWILRGRASDIEAQAELFEAEAMLAVPLSLRRERGSEVCRPLCAFIATLKPAFRDMHRIARPHLTVRRHDARLGHAVDLVRDLDAPLEGARRIAAGDCDRGLD